MITLDTIRREIVRATAKLQSTVRRGVLRLVSSDYFVQLETWDDERFDDVELWQQFGLTSRPPAGGEALAAKVEGRGEGAVVVATTDRAHRPGNLADGDTVVYAKKALSSQARVHLQAAGDVDCTPGTGKTINVGGPAASCVDFLLKGTAFNTGMGAYLGAMVSAGTTWAGSSKLLPDVVAYIEAHVAAITALNVSYAAGVGWLATKGKVC